MAYLKVKETTSLGYRTFVVVDEDGDEVCFLSRTYMNEGEENAKAVAKLLAASPDLMRVLIKLVELPEAQTYTPEWNEARNIVRQVEGAIDAAEKAIKLN